MQMLYPAGALVQGMVQIIGKGEEQGSESLEFGPCLIGGKS